MTGKTPNKINRLKILRTLLLVTCLCFSVAQTFSQRPVDRLPNLKAAIRKVLQDTGTPGMGVAIVTRDSTVWIAGMGKADVENNVDADENTLFRIGSITKMFVALSILKLQEEGKLDLQARVRDLVPDVQFENRWEEDNPVRVIHLLEHTTGWDDYHLVEQTTKSLSLKDGLDFHPHSRKSRWVPGSRMAYSNSGAPVAAYIVERITGQVFEDYVAKNFFQPLGMDHTTFFDDEKHKQFGATLYGPDRQPLPYLQIIHRPAGAINSSASDMAKFVRMLLNRGGVDTASVILPESLDRMEVPGSTPGHLAGLQLGAGLANFTSIHNGFVYQGHNGAVPGGLAELGYLPQQGIGHAFFINAANSDAFFALSKLIRDFETSLVISDSASGQIASVSFDFEDGFYYPINPRMQSGYFLDRLIDIYAFEKRDSIVRQSWIFPSASRIFTHVSGLRFKSEQSGRTSLVSGVDPIEGAVLYTDSRVYKPVPSWIVYGQFALIGVWMVMMCVGTIVWIFALGRSWSRKSRDTLRISTFPMISTLSFVSLTAAVLVAMRHFGHHLTGPGAVSLFLLALSVWFIVAVTYSWVRLFRFKKVREHRFSHGTMVLLSSLHVLVALYLLWFDVIPFVTWA